MEAIDKLDLSVLRILCQHYDVNTSSLDSYGRPPPGKVARVVYGVVFSWLWRHGASVNPYSEEGGTAVLFDCFLEDAAIVRLLLEWKADIWIPNGVNWLSLKQMTLLMLAAWKGSFPVTMQLLRHRSMHHDQPTSPSLHLVRASDAQGRTALHWAAEHGHASLLWPLLQAGSDITQRNAKGQTALDACGKGPRGRACAEALRAAVGVRLLQRGRAASDEAHRVAMLLRLPRLQGEAEKAGEGIVGNRKGKRNEGMSRRMIAFLLNEQTPYVKIHGKPRREPRKSQGKEADQEEEGKIEEEEVQAERRQAVLAYVLGVRMTRIKGGEVLTEELFEELVDMMTLSWGED